jgi:hypothetical protein
MMTVFDYNQIQVSFGYNRDTRELIMTVREKGKLVHSQCISLPWLLRELNVVGEKNEPKIPSAH